MKSEGIAPLRAVPSLYACVPAENSWTIALESTRSHTTLNLKDIQMCQNML